MMIEVFSNGGGTQSVAASALIIQGRLPRPDFVVIADTGREMPTTWKYLDEVIRPAFKAIGIEVHRVSKEKYASPRGKEIFATSGDLMIPVYTNQNGEAAKLSAFCSGAWKTEVIDRWLSKEHGITRSKVRKWICFSKDETRRIRRLANGKEFRNGLIWFPLVQGVPVVRDEAIHIVKKMGWPEPPRSRCFDCPNQSDLEWNEVKTDWPAEFGQACQRDEEIRTKDPFAFLHSSLTPLRDADVSKRDDVFSGGCHSGECFL